MAHGPACKVVKTHLRRLLACFLITVLASGAVLGTVFGVVAVRTSLEAEKTHHAYIGVLEALETYLRETDGRWPRDWDELSTAGPQREPRALRWPNDLAEIRRRVHVRFDVTASDVAAMEVERFSAVEPVGPNYGPAPYLIEPILKAARHQAK